MTDVSMIKQDRINGLVRRPSGIYVPTKENLKQTLDRCLIPPEEKINYVPQGKEIESLETYRQISTSVLLSGPTGIGKTMLARYMAKKLGVPFLWLTCSPDKTEGRVLGSNDLVFGTVDTGNETKVMHMQQFRPSPISIAALSGEPVVLFIDELHKLRKDMDAAFYSLVNERKVNLSDVLGTGEIYDLHPQTIVLLALNPYYNDGGIEKISPAMRQRLATMYFEMVTEPSKLTEIVAANLGWDRPPRSIADTVTKVIELHSAICKVYLEHQKRSLVGSNDSKTMEIKSRLKSMLMNINEAPSPRTLVATVRAIEAGLDPATAVLQCTFNAITNDFGATARGLVTMAKDVYGI